MATDREGAFLAHISDTVTTLAEQMGEHRQVQQNILAVLQSMLRTAEAQSEMLAEILDAATQDTGPSPVAEALKALTAEVRELDANQTALIAQVAELPAAIGRAFETSLKDWPTAAATEP